MKNCNTCKQYLDNSNFPKDKNRKDGLTSKCINCYKIYNSQRYENNKGSIKEHNIKWNQENKEKNKKTWKIYYQKNRKSLIEKSTKWNQENKERFNKNQRENRDPIRNSISTRINKVLRKYLNEGKQHPIEHYLGCTIEEYKSHLEKQFTSEMNWENYGKNKYWEIDHIYPLSKGGNFHYTNCQPLTITENRQKSNKI